MRLFTFVLMAVLHSFRLLAGDVVWFDGSHPVTYTVDSRVDPVVTSALRMFSEDMKMVTGMAPVQSHRATIKIVQGKKTSDGFRIFINKGQIVVEGENGRGTAYGILELSRMAGVSPWVWWGDVVPEKKDRLALPDGFMTEQHPSVEYRGIFLNDEDWSTRPWSNALHASSSYGQIGVQAYKRIFQLLLRLRANAIWPGMHPGTTAFFKIPRAKQLADSFGIVTGSSHCEPMLRNNVDEWVVSERGRFNYRTNRQSVLDYWSERLNDVRYSVNNMFTIGMRGIHDSSMEGYQTNEEKLLGLQQVIDDQQALLKRYFRDPSKLMQVFVPYKEVLQLYQMGLKVPEDVTLMWCDDNYGYMTRLPDAGEQQRRGGNGVYYHLSYWGRPHDYLWLTTTQPGLICHEMREAYNHHARKLWIANVHDPKVAGYDLELFLDLAWNIDAITEENLDQHYLGWLCRQFGDQVGQRLFPVMNEYFQLCGQRRPEFMGWNQVELDKRLYDRGLGQVRNTEYSMTEFGGELDYVLARYQSLSQSVDEIGMDVRAELQDAYFAAVKYPVQAAAAHATKLLEAQRSRQLADGNTNGNLSAKESQIKQAVAKSQSAYRQIGRLTDYYNHQMAGGKWNHLMSDHPRDLPVFWSPLTPIQLCEDEMKQVLASVSDGTYSAHLSLKVGDDVIARNASQYDSTDGNPKRIKMLGHGMNAISLPKEESVTYSFHVNEEGDFLLTTALIPTQPCDDGELRYSVSIDGKSPTVYSLKEPFRSEQWKLNVLRGQTLRQQKLFLSTGDHTITVKALDDHIVVDQWMIDRHLGRKHYLIPAR